MMSSGARHYTEIVKLLVNRLRVVVVGPAAIPDTELKIIATAVKVCARRILKHKKGMCTAD